MKRQCELLALPRSTAYYQQKELTEQDPGEIRIKNAMDRIHFNEPSYGSRRIRKELEQMGFFIGRDLTRRYMQEMGIVAFYPGPNLSKRDLKDRTYPYLKKTCLSPTLTKFGGSILPIVGHLLALSI